ncbi:cysteine dioxygenase type 1-like [Saccoglossus kowalevskii]|uniref:Cysteine dioxygenase n=1 Tax=Saccoglossus kowalevskii TaxID=10224 RepID=A0ABM0GTM2_SACKO|nr:PREDICTED: cysteine dioxygenase type 1-like [Saccoglossus kowalevskii]
MCDSRVGKPYFKEPSCMEELIETLNTLFESDCVNVEEVQSVMENFKSKESDWRRFAKFDPNRYTRNLVDEGNGKYNLILLCWGEGQGSGIHSHSDAHCFLKVMDGTLRETLYEWPSKSEGRTKMKVKKIADCEMDQVAYINDSYGVHRVENTSNVETAVSLHLYSPPFESCDCFDERTGKKQSVKITFWSKFGERTYGVGACKSAVYQPENN